MKDNTSVKCEAKFIEVECDESSSSDPLLEIRLNEHVRKSEISDFDLRALVVKCSACDQQLNHHTLKEVRKHRKLGVITCKSCYDFYGSEEFSQDESGYNYCTWCGNGGKLIVCDYCPHGFCKDCIRRNFGRAEISLTTKEGWKCYCCNRSRLKEKVNFCNFITDRTKKDNMKKDQKEKKPFQTQSKVFAEGFLQSAFDESDAACKNFHKKMSKLKSIGISKSKSLKHIVKKMEELISDHKFDLKNIAHSLSSRFESYIKDQVKLEQECAKLNTKKDSDIDEKPNSDVECIVFDAEQSNKDIKDNLNDSHSILETDDVNKSKEQNIKAKLLLLKSSSGSDSDVTKPDDKEVSFPTISNDCDEQMTIDSNTKPDDKEVSFSTISNDCDEQMTIDSNPTQSKISNGENSLNDNGIVDVSKSTVKRKLSFGFSGSSNDEFSLGFEEIENVLDKKSGIEKSKKEIDKESDPKLKLSATVDIIKCDNLLTNGETCVKISEDDDSNQKLDDDKEKLDKPIDDDEEDKIIDRLCRLPESKPPPKMQGKKKTRTLTKAAAKEGLLESSSSISLSSEDEDQKNITIPKKNPVKDILFASKKGNSGSDSSSAFSDSDVEDEEVEKKKKKSKKAKNDSSSDDFIPVRKKKYDKLLHASLFSDDEKKPKEKKDKKLSKKRKLLSSDEEKSKLNSDKARASDVTNTSSDSEMEKKKRPKKRRRIKKCDSSSNEDEEEKDPSQDSTPGKGRKNIRKIVSKEKISLTTKEAQTEERERRKRIQDRQNLYNKVTQKSEDGKSIITEKMVLEIDKDSKEEIVQIHPDLVIKLKPHQVNGVKFMWDCTIESVKDLDKPGSGCILAHCMGLGKTLQVIAFLHTCLTNPFVKKYITTAMIICPYNTALNWAVELDYWLEDVEYDIKVHQLASVKTNFERLDVLDYWFKEGGIIILSYDIFRRLSSNTIKLKSKLKKQLQEYLLDPGPDIVVCDEGHILKNENSAISKATLKLRTRRRIVLTGTPLQNNLREYHCMVDFVKPNLLGSRKEFLNRFVNPIINGQYDDSNQYDVKLMKKRIHILHKLLEGCVQRCDYSALTKFLPPKLEFVISVKLSEVQIKMYECYLEKITTTKKEMKNISGSLFIDFNNLRCIWNHPYTTHISHERAEYKKMFKDDEDEEDKFINDESVSEASESSSTTSDEDKLLSKIDKDKKKAYRTRSKAGEEESDDEEIVELEQNKQWYHEFISDKDKYNIEISGKMVLLMEILKECESIGDKIILFSQSLLALDAIEDVLEYSSSLPIEEEEKDRIGTWVKGLDYFRMDGTTTVDIRKSCIDMFNDPSNERARLFLISTRAGSLGTNLVGANRVIIFDTSWNPSHDVQAIFRVYRFGQIKPVYIYRLLAQGTMEEKIYDRQVTKLSLSCRVVDEQQIDRHFSAADLAELYQFDRNSTTNRPTPMVPKDRLLAELLIKKKDWIVTYHEHDSLLQNQTEEDLTEEERQAAWTEYENEREGRTSQPNYNINYDIAKEPDFSQDYTGKLLPDIRNLIKDIVERIKTESPEIVGTLEFKRRVMANVIQLRQVFQEKHVKVLRKKQEFCTRGTVPSSVNKYLDETTEAIEIINTYIKTLTESINNDERKQFQARVAQAQAQARHNQQVYNMQQQMRAHLLQGSVGRGTGTPLQRIIFGGRAPTNIPYPFATQGYTSQRPTYPSQFNQQNYSRNQASQQPKITEVEDNANVPKPTAGSNNSSKSTVIIEEIT